ncbi:HNH endonuclease [Microcoleus sp. FACHB-68]|nr:HNH endonuclease [Microcoleus sp. FACHB-68]
MAKKSSKRMSSKQKRNAREKLIALDGSYCAWCGKELLEDQLTIDHFTPLSKGGSNSFENLRLACSPCNKWRGNSRFPPGWKPVTC